MATPREVTADALQTKSPRSLIARGLDFSHNADQERRGLDPRERMNIAPKHATPAPSR